MRLHVLHVNDVHSQLENYMRLGGALRRLRNALRQSGEAVLTFDVGDLLDRVRPETEATFGLVNAAMMAALGCDGWVFGNNEGLTVPLCHWSVLAERSGARVFCANLRAPDGERFPFFCDERWYDIAGVRVGVFGVTPDYESTYRAVGARALDPFAAAQHCVRRLREAGCDVVIALSHLGLGADRRLAAAAPGIDVILGGHTHQFMSGPEWVGKTAVFQPGKHALVFGHTLIDYDERSRTVREVRCEPVPVDLSAPYDQQMLSAYRGYLPDVEQRLAEPVAQLDQPLLVKFDRESPFANVLVDALFAAYPCDMGMMMAGALTASLLPGSVERQHVLAACTTPTRPVRMTLTGEEIRSILEKSVRPEYYGRAGIGFGFRGSVVGFIALAGAEARICRSPDGAVKVEEIRVGGEVLQPNRAYRVVTCEYLWLAPVFEEFRRGRDIEFGAPLVREVLLERM
ncbi:MAG: bifunctional metallophosphatase/5'-nucleotidase, partial [Alicyclobacillus sp.]|nr:bifunctional metallophosphatase/5'-nucleotidase [Alicyclobacillus sp.]